MLENEHIIIKQAQKGDSHSFGVLYDHYVAQIYRFVYVKVSHKHEAEDLTHEIFLKAWQHINSFNDKGHPFSSWLYQIARNRIIDYYRTKKETIDIELIRENDHKEDNDFDILLDTKNDLARIKERLSQLTEDQQNVIIFRYIEDLSPAEIAHIMRKSESAVRVIQHRAIHILKEQLENDGTLF